MMVPATRLFKVRLALVGDAGYRTKFFSGSGAAAALLGADSLSRQLARRDPVGALAAYEARLVPLAKGYQASALSGRRRTLARGATGLLRIAFVRVVPDKLGEIASRRFYQAEVTLQSLG